MGWTRPAGSVVALLPIEQLPDGVQMTGVPGGLFHHVDQHPSQGRSRRIEVGVLAYLIQRMSRDYLVGHGALALVLLKELRERDAGHHHVGVLVSLIELRPDGRAAQED